MIDNKLKAEIKKYIQVYYSFEWGTRLLEELKDKENLKMIQELKKLYKSKAFDLMREHNIDEIAIPVTSTNTLTLKFDKNLKNKF